MKLALVLLLIIVAVYADSIQLPSGEQYTTTVTQGDYEKLFEKFVHKYEKMYGSNAVDRFQIFKKNVQYAMEMNQLNGDNVMGITKFSDLEPSEFKKTYLMRSFTAQHIKDQMKPTKTATVSQAMISAAPESWNWVEHGAVTPVKNQGACGSCWTFSTTGNVEGAWYLAKKELVSLSEQNLVDCDHNCDNEGNCDLGCDGGFMWNAFKYIQTNGGIDTEESYPYEGTADTCRYKNSTRGATISGWIMLSTNEDEIAAWLAIHGPIAVALNANPLQYYTGGVLEPRSCDPAGLDHAVLLVGYGTAKNNLGVEKKYWLVKNSWGPSWGEKGYFRILRGSNTCGIASFPCTVQI